MSRQQVKRTNQSREAKRRIFRRTVFLLCVFGVLIFIPLIWKLYYWQILRHDELEEMAIDQQTSETSVTANRGKIYDSSGNVLAISSTTYDVIISPKAIMETQKSLDEKKEAALKKAASSDDTVDVSQYEVDVKTVVAEGLAQILDGVSADSILEKCEDTNSQYKKLASKVEADVAEEIRTLISDNDISGCIYLTPQSKRYYPYSTLAAQIIGFTNDQGGAYGLEAQLEDQLAGTAGLVVTAKNNRGTDLKNFFQDYYEAEDGNDVYLTLDATIQSYCEKYLNEGIKANNVLNGGFVIVMDCDTGAILGMASSPTYDLNSYSEVIDSVLSQEVANGSLSESDAINRMWRNKAVNDTYEPGSTFKSIVLAAALEEGVISESSTFGCTGSMRVADRTIGCSGTHGNQLLAAAVGHSCNSAFMTIGQKLGSDTLYDYVEAFGLLDATGIDVPGESQGIFWEKSKMGITNLATASFGQRFTVTPIGLITAINAVVNGGYLRQPYVVDHIVDETGNNVYEADTEPVRQVISEETSARAASILEGVVTSYTGKNAYVEGYRIGGKTGTSQTLDEDRYVVSFMGFAPADDPQIIVLLALDQPEVASPGSDYCSNGMYISGGNMAAPLVGQLIADVLDYQGFVKEYTAADLSGAGVSMPTVVGYDETMAKTILSGKNLTYRVVGDGSTVTGQIPAAGVSLPSGSQVILYMGEEVPDDQVEMPDLNGYPPDKAIDVLNSLDLYMTASGSSGYYTSNTLAYKQSIEPGVMVDRGTTVTVYFADDTIIDYGDYGLE
jgi:stage V sporulation protein D (sporulation-specific penicillin-binding protein)